MPGGGSKTPTPKAAVVAPTPITIPNYPGASQLPGFPQTNTPKSYDMDRAIADYGKIPQQPQQPSSYAPQYQPWGGFERFSSQSRQPQFTNGYDFSPGNDPVSYWQNYQWQSPFDSNNQATSGFNQWFDQNKGAYEQQTQDLFQLANIGDEDLYLKGSKTPVAYNVPNDSFSVAGQKVSSRTYNPETGNYESNVNIGDPNQVNALNSLLNKSYLGAEQALATTPAEKQAYADNIYNPAARELMSSYNKQLGGAVGSASAMGALNSLGFEDYRAKTLDKQLGEGLANLRAQATLEAENLPSIRLSPFVNASAAGNAALDNYYDRAVTALNPSFAGAGQGFSQSAQEYNDRLNSLRLYQDINNQHFQNLLAQAEMINNYNLNNAANQNNYNQNVYNTQTAASSVPRQKFLGIF